MNKDPRGPIRTIVAVEKHPDKTLVTLSCGHVAKLNQIFHYKIGEDCRCFACKKEGKE